MCVSPGVGGLAGVCPVASLALWPWCDVLSRWNPLIQGQVDCFTVVEAFLSSATASALVSAHTTAETHLRQKIARSEAAITS